MKSIVCKYTSWLKEEGMSPSQPINPRYLRWRHDSITLAEFSILESSTWRTQRYCSSGNRVDWRRKPIKVLNFARACILWPAKFWNEQLYIFMSPIDGAMPGSAKIFCHLLAKRAHTFWKGIKYWYTIFCKNHVWHNFQRILNGTS
jgi:hypothetical protein